MAVFKAYKLEVEILDDVYLHRDQIKRIVLEALKNYAEVVKAKVYVVEEHTFDGETQDGVLADA